MLHLTKLTLACGLLASMASYGQAQSEQPKHYHLDFAVKELDGGKVTNTRHYFATAATGEGHKCNLRNGSKLPLIINDKGEVTYLDVGVNIDCNNVFEKDGDLVLDLEAEISSAVPGNTKQPVIRQNKWRSNVTVPIGKPTVIFSSDDVSSKGQVQFELTATPIK